MSLNRDIKSKWLLHFKGFLFLATGLLAAGIILYESPNLRTLLFLIVAIWSFCRFYYYLFYVLEKYAGGDQKYAGILDALKYILRGRLITRPRHQRQEVPENKSQ
jgi:hypothetical protein